MSEVNYPEAGSARKPRKISTQPLHVLQEDDALLKLKTLQALSGLGRTTLYAKEKAGELEIQRLGSRCNRVTGREAKRFLRAQGKEVAV